MFCTKCGEMIPDKSVVCPECGAELKNPEENNVEQTASYVSQGNSGIQRVGTRERKKKPLKRILTAVGVAAAVSVIFFTFTYIQKSQQKAELSKIIQKKWSDYDDSIIRILDFSSGDEVEYRLETGYSWMDTSVFTCDYKVISGNQIQLDLLGGDNYKTYTVTFNDDKTLMIVKPAITSTDSSEFWYDLDD